MADTPDLVSREEAASALASAQKWMAIDRGHERLLETIVALHDALAAKDATIAELVKALKAIHLRLAPGSRTFDVLLQDAMHADDLARAALSRARGGE
jgi:hypothetical protein